MFETSIFRKVFKQYNKIRLLMVKNKKVNDFKDYVNQGNVSFTNHSLEFSKFYQQQKQLCDNISGVSTDNNVSVTKKTLNIGFNMLWGFIGSYDYALSHKSYREEIMNSLKKLENKFVNDDEYNGFIQKSSNLTFSQETIFNKLYLYYIFGMFEIIYKFSSYLQSSLNISSKEIIKNIGYVDYTYFYNNVSEYKTENNNNISELSYENIYDNFVKVLGFFYTYRFLMRKFVGDEVKEVIVDLFDELVSDDSIRKIAKLRENNMNKSGKVEIIEELTYYKELVIEIYRAIYKEMQGKNILPQSVNKVMVDNTLI